MRYSVLLNQAAKLGLSVFTEHIFGVPIKNAFMANNRKQ